MCKNIFSLLLYEYSMILFGITQIHFSIWSYIIPHEFQLQQIMQSRPQQGKRRGRPPKNHTRNRSRQQARRTESSRSRSRERRREERQHQGSSSVNEDFSSQIVSSNAVEDLVPAPDASNTIYASYLRSTFIDFFHKLNHNKGFVFTQKDRQKLMKEQLRKVKRDSSYTPFPWKNQSQWQEDIEQEKVSQVIQQFLSQLSEGRKTDLKEILVGSSYLFADQVTSELYSLIVQIVKIGIENEDGLREAQVKEFMRKVASVQGNFKFFNFSFSSYFQLTIETSAKNRTYEELGVNIMRVLHNKI